ncbi:hypothetical protein GCM10028833_25790 [Glycomyces tarimensis]
MAAALTSGSLGGHEVVDLGAVALAVAVNAAGALFELVGVERDVVVDQAVAVVLEVDALAGGVGGEQDAQPVVGGVGLEGQADLLAVFDVHAAVEERDAVAAEALGAEEVVEPVEGVAVLGEDHDAVVQPLAVGLARRVEEGEEARGLGVGDGEMVGGPFGISASRACSVGSRRSSCPAERRRLSSSNSKSCSSSRTAVSSRKSS